MFCKIQTFIFFLEFTIRLFPNREGLNFFSELRKKSGNCVPVAAESFWAESFWADRFRRNRFGRILSYVIRKHENIYEKMVHNSDRSIHV